MGCAPVSWLRRTYRWSAWDRARFIAPWFCLGLLIGAALDIASRIAGN